MFKIKYNSIKVRNIKQSVEFYQKLFNLEITDEYYSKSLSVVMLTDGYINLELIEDHKDEYGLNNIGFVVDNLRELLDEFEGEDIIIDKENYDKLGFITLKDPNDTVINIIEEKQS